VHSAKRGKNQSLLCCTYCEKEQKLVWQQTKASTHKSFRCLTLEFAAFWFEFFSKGEISANIQSCYYWLPLPTTFYFND
jgi:hypothetical protein